MNNQNTRAAGATETIANLDRWADSFRFSKPRTNDHRATGGNIALILVSHTHHDHVGAVAELKDATGAPTVGYRVSGLETFEPDIKLADGDSVAGADPAVLRRAQAPDHRRGIGPGGVPQRPTISPAG